MPKEYQPNTAYAGNILALGTNNLGKQLVVNGHRFSLNAEASTGAAAVVTLSNPVQEIVVWATTATWLATTADALGVTGAGTHGSRFFLPANESRVLPWWQDEVHHQAVAGGGNLYIEGRI